MSQTNTKTIASSGATHPERAASLNADGTQKWFIPPYALPAIIILLVATRAIYLG